MPINFTCPHCGTRTNVADQYAGQSGPCAQCGQTVTVPYPAGPATYVAPSRRLSGVSLALVIVVCVLMVTLVCGGVLAALLLPAVQSAREAARRAACMNNMKQISLALMSYESANGHFPPAYEADENGRPKHSWRVLILPYMEERALYDAYNMKEPWDSPGNLAVARSMPMPSIFRCPSSANTPGSQETCYAMIVGPGTISDGPTSSKMQDIKDGVSNTIMVVEVSGDGINWMEPRDLDAKAISYMVNDGSGQGIQSDHPGGANAAMCDGSVRFLDGSIDPETLRGMSTIAGGEPINGAF